MLYLIGIGGRSSVFHRDDEPGWHVCAFTVRRFPLDSAGVGNTLNDATALEDLGFQYEPALLDYRHLPVHQRVAWRPRMHRSRSAPRGVTLAAPRRSQLHKVFDRRHKLTVNLFDKVTTEWSCGQCGATRGHPRRLLGGTHSLADQAIIREVFGAVHTLSLVVGSANRADIRQQTPG